MFDIFFYMWYNKSTKNERRDKTMALKDFKNDTGLRAVVCNAKGKVWSLTDIPESIKHKQVIDTDVYPSEDGQVLYVWI